MHAAVGERSDLEVTDVPDAALSEEEGMQQDALMET